MNRQQLKKTEGQYVRLPPPAVGPRGEEVDEDWLVREVRDDVIELQNTQRGVVAAIGFDHIFNYFSDGTRGNAHQRYGLSRSKCTAQALLNPASETSSR